MSDSQLPAHFARLNPWRAKSSAGKEHAFAADVSCRNQSELYRMSLTRVMGLAALALACASVPTLPVRRRGHRRRGRHRRARRLRRRRRSRPRLRRRPRSIAPTRSSPTRGRPWAGRSWPGSRSVLGTGRTRRVRGDNLVPIEFEIAIELPDKYVRKDEVPAEESEPTSTGFAGDLLIQYPPPPQIPGRAGGPGPAGAPAGRPGAAPPAAGTPVAAAATPPAGATPPSLPACNATCCRCTAAAGAPPPAAAAPPAGAHLRQVPRLPGGATPGAKPMMPSAPTPEMLAAQGKMRLNTAKQEFARLALGLFAASPSYPMTYSFAARAEAPQGTADVLDVQGRGQLRDAPVHPRRYEAAGDGELAGTADQRHRDRSGAARAEDRRARRGGHHGAGAAAAIRRRRKTRPSTRRRSPRCARRRRRRRSSTASTSRTTATWTASSCRSGCAARSARTPPRRPRSIASG